MKNPKDVVLGLMFGAVIFSFTGCYEGREALSISQGKKPFRTEITKMVALENTVTLKTTENESSEELGKIINECKTTRKQGDGVTQKPTAEEDSVGGAVELQLSLHGLDWSKENQIKPEDTTIPVMYSDCGQLTNRSAAGDNGVMLEVKTACRDRGCGQVAILIHSVRAKGIFSKDEDKEFFKTQLALVYRPNEKQFDLLHGLTASGLEQTDRDKFLTMRSFLEILSQHEIR